MMMAAFLASPTLSADLNVGDVVFCTSDIFYGTNVNKADEIKRYKNESIRLSISNNAIKFGTSGYFADSEMPIRDFKQWTVTAQDKYSTFELDAYQSKISFYYASANPFGMALMKGSCDKF
jgi:hypothetical protein